MGVGSDTDPTGRAPAGPVPTDERWHLVLVALLVMATPFMFHVGRDQWFFLDDWEFLVHRELSDPRSLLREHNGHWVTVPAVAYRVLFRGWGISAYWPYQALAVAGHYGVVVAVWKVMRRLKVRASIATGVVLPLLVFGSGSANIVSAFQVTMTAPLALGLAALLLADHDGPFGRRDLAAMACGLVGLMCSGVAVPLVGAVGTGALFRRGWRVAALHVLPLGLLYAAWHAAADVPSVAVGDVAVVVEFATRIVVGSFEALGQFPPVALLIATLTVVGIAVVVGPARTSLRRNHVALGSALLVSCLGFVLLTGSNRALSGDEAATSGRYLYIVAALLLPFVAAGINWIATRPRGWIGAGVALAVVAAGLPGNISALTDQPPHASALHRQTYALTRSANFGVAPEDKRFVQVPGSHLGPTVGWLRRMVRSGRGPGAVDLLPRMVLAADVWLALDQEAGPVEHESCPRTGREVRLRRGDRVTFDGQLEVVLSKGPRRSRPVVFDATYGNVLVANTPIVVTVRPMGAGELLLC